MRIRHLRFPVTAALVLTFAAVPATHAAPVAAPAVAPCAGAATGGLPVFPWSHDLGTGEDNNAPHAFTTVDPEWTVEPGGAPAYSVDPNQYWYTVGHANWINHSPTRASNGLPTTTFRTYFNLPALSYARTVTLTFAADNGVSFFLNGNAPLNYMGGFDPPVPPAPPTTAFDQPHTLTYTGPAFVNGLNYIDAVVSDYGYDTGLLVFGSATACVTKQPPPGTCVVVRPDGLGFYWYSPAPYDLGTGESGYTPFPPTTADDDWTTVAPAPGPAYAVATYSGWVGSATSSWINTVPHATRGLGGSRTYQVQFPLSASATNVLLDIWFAADNDVEFYLNTLAPTAYIGGVQNMGQQAFNQKYHLTAVSGFQPGTVNTLYAVVHDQGVATGLLVEGGVSSCDKRAG